LGKAAFFTIEFRRLANRIGWPDDVNIDLIRRGLVEEVRKKFEKLEKPKNLFEATNIIIGIDKKCFIEQELKIKEQKKNTISKTFRRKQYEFNKSSLKNNHKNKFNKHHGKEELLSANYTPSSNNSMTTTFLIIVNEKKINLNALIDSGSARSYLCKDFVQAHRIPKVNLPTPMSIQLPNQKGMIVKQTTKKLELIFMDHKELYEFFIANLQLNGIALILRRDWLNLHQPYINFRTNKIYFLEDHCLSHCPSSKGNKFIFHNKNTTATIISDTAVNDQIIPSSLSEDELYDFDVCAAIPDLGENVKQKIINEYYPDLLIVFEKKEEDKLSPHREYEISIDLIPGGQLYYGPIYSLTVVEMQALREYLKENLAKGFIRKSKSPAGAPILFVIKQDGTLRLCVDYRRLNFITIRNSYPIPRLSDLMESFKGAKIFTRLYLRSAYNLVRVKEGHEYLTAFRTPIGHFEYLVMPFGLRNAPSIFQRFIQDVLADCIGFYVQVYLNDIIIYSPSTDVHVKHVRTVLKLLIDHGLYVKLEKCDFHVKETKFLGFIVSIEGLTMDKGKLISIIDWPAPKNVKELQSFLGLCNFYRKFIKNFSTIIEPL